VMAYNVVMPARAAEVEVAAEAVEGGVA